MLSRALGAAQGSYLAALAVVAAVDLRIAAVVLAIGALGVAWTSVRRRRPSAPDWSGLTRFLNFVGIATVGSLVLSVGLATVGLPSSATPPRPATAGPFDAPDIYLVLLDGYPRADTLKSARGFDNSEFLEEADRLGFDLAERAHSNYNRTGLTLASFLNAAPIDDLMPNPPGGIVAQNRWLSSLISRASAVQVARQLGYEFVHLPTDVAYLTPWSADRLIDAGQLSAFEYQVMANGLLTEHPTYSMIPLFRADHAQRILGTFEALEGLAQEASAGPRLVFAHVMAPHHPIVFRRDGTAVTVDDCYWEDCNLAEPLSESLKADVVEQIEFTSTLVLNTARTIIDASPGSVVVFFSDHGFRHWLGDGSETFRSLLLAHTPDHPSLFPATSTPVNVIPRILNAYLGTTQPLADESFWATTAGAESYFPLRTFTTEPSP
ncbi:MAG: hypothetical protein FIA92_04380 [Chloroflexi bacterium]|nr:hypothetical protein [Chloroflexota bacterium]